ncbi:uncharacterized protein LOC132738023 isoform X2 [Ruditapes philippinarum]|uniref:uncharacterized protein LOC132738023 isoform X2 n=1 Tax=Ruditapes philippinarum TaxID=129788 RepID=UPI00295B0751|nr:uncharacterized protein LOC132738023 isoform X2 [Ruditapes philippinarum]
MNRLSRNDYKAHSRMNKNCSSKRAKSLCGTKRRHDSQRKLTNRIKAADDKTSQKKRRSKSVLPPQGQRRSMPQKHGQAAQRKRRTTGHNNSRAEIRNQSAYELKMYLDDNYDYNQHTNRNDRKTSKVPASPWNGTKVSEDVSSNCQPKLKRDNREADDIQCQLTKQQTSGDQTVKYIQHANLHKNITDICPKSQSTSIWQISEKLLQDAIRNELAKKKKIKKGFFTNAFRSILACFGIKNDRK